jgi:hypothetical protein
MIKQNKNILNIDNYNVKLDNTDKILQEYTILLNEYLIHIIKHLVIKDNIHYLFVINRGFDLFKNIFIILLHYTKNLELVVHHLRKSYLYYTEFIGQVGEDSNSFLQLNSKDACLFVYKKTIYEINEDFKKKHELNDKEKKVFFNLKEKIYIITKIIKIICKNNIDGDNNFLKNDKEKYVKNIKNFMTKIVNELKKNKKEEKYEIIFLFIDYIEDKKIEIEKKQTLIYHFIKKTIISDIKMKKIYKLSLNDDEYIKLTPIKFINKLFRRE